MYKYTHMPVEICAYHVPLIALFSGPQAHYFLCRLTAEEEEEKQDPISWLIVIH